MATKLETGPKSGFTLIELLVVVMIIGILAAIGIPQYFKIVEKDRAGEAVSLFFALKGAQDRYNAKYNSFCTVDPCLGLDVTLPSLRYFTVGAFGAGTAGGWKLTLTRTDSPAIYGSYTLMYDSGAAPPLTCTEGDGSTPCPDLLPNP